MASSGKRKTTMAKLNRERRLRERRMEKQVRRDLRKQEAAEHRRQLADSSAAEAAPTAPRTRGGAGALCLPERATGAGNGRDRLVGSPCGEASRIFLNAPASIWRGKWGIGGRPLSTEDVKALAAGGPAKA
jgi:hypothetical protein